MVSEEEKRGRHREHQRARREHRKEAGLCFRCGASLDREGSLCSSCYAKVSTEEYRKRARESRRERTKRRKEAGLCIQCGSSLDRKGSICSSCYAKTSTEAYRKRARKYQKAKREHRKEAGLCTECGAPLDREGLVCSSCYEKHKIRNREWARLNRSRHAVKRRQVFEMLCGGKPRCVRCGCEVYEALELNHKKGGGAHERRNTSSRSRLLYQLASGKRDAADFEVTCIVCNAAHYAEMKTGLTWKVTFLG